MAVCKDVFDEWNLFMWFAIFRNSTLIVMIMEKFEICYYVGGENNHLFVKRRGRLLNAGARTCLELWWIDASPFVRSFGDKLYQSERHLDV